MTEPISPELRRAIEETVEESFKRILTQIGIDTDNPIKAQARQADISEVLEHLKDEQYQADQLHLRRWRKSMEQVGSVTIKVALGIIISGVLGMLWVGFKAVTRQ